MISKNNNNDIKNLAFYTGNVMLILGYIIISSLFDFWEAIGIGLMFGGLYVIVLLFYTNNQKEKVGDFK
jgi:fucose permease